MSGRLSLGQAAALGFSALLVGIGIGRFGYPAFIPAVIDAGWVTPEAAHLAAASNLAGYVVGALTSTAIARVIGGRATVVSCLWLTVASFALSATPISAVPFALLRFLSGFTGGALMTAVAPIIALRVDPDKRGRASGYAFAGIGVGFILSGTVVPVLAEFGLGSAWIAIAGVLAAASVVAWWALPVESHEPPGPAIAHSSGMFSNRAVIGLAIAYSASATGYVPATVIFVDYVGRVLDLGLATGGIVWIATGLSAVVSPPAAGYLADRYGFAVTLRLALLAMGLGAGIPTVTSAPAWLALSGMLTGGLMVALSSLVSGRTREIARPGQHTATWAMLTVLFALFQAGAAYAVSALLALTGSYLLIFSAAAVIMLLGLAAEVMLTLGQKPQGANGPDR